MLDLNEIRNSINGIDDQIIELYKARMELSKQVGLSKKETGKALAAKYGAENGRHNKKDLIG